MKKVVKKSLLDDFEAIPIEFTEEFMVGNHLILPPGWYPVKVDGYGTKLMNGREERYYTYEGCKKNCDHHNQKIKL